MFLFSIKYWVGGDDLFSKSWKKGRSTLNIFDVEWGEEFLLYNKGGILVFKNTLISESAIDELKNVLL